MNTSESAYQLLNRQIQPEIFYLLSDKSFKNFAVNVTPSDGSVTHRFGTVRQNTYTYGSAEKPPSASKTDGMIHANLALSIDNASDDTILGAAEPVRRQTIRRMPRYKPDDARHSHAKTRINATPGSDEAGNRVFNTEKAHCKSFEKHKPQKQD